MSNILQTLGLNDADAAFKRAWEEFGFVGRNAGPNEHITMPVQSAIMTNPANRKAMKGFARKSLASIAKGEKPTDWIAKSDMPAVVKSALTSSDISGNVPVVFDPEIFALLKTEAPFLASVAVEGQRGLTATYNKITARGGPIGFVSEATAADLSGATASKSTYAKGTQDMKIWVDLVQVSDFAQAIGDHYFDLRETEFGQRLALHAQVKEEAFFYGDPSLAKTDGSAFDANAYPGLTKICTTAGMNVDKSAVDVTGTDGLLRDIKAEIAALLQGTKAISLSDLEIWTSHTLFDVLENQLEVKRRINANENSVSYGFDQLFIKGIPVNATHTIDSHTHSAASKGNAGDVFIVNKRASRFRALAPLSTLDLARVGLASRTAIYEFGTMIDRADGAMSRVLQAYPTS